jgi:ABC-type multidrug transport system permease subunit
MPNFYVSDSLSMIFHEGKITDPAILQNLLILAAISAVVAAGGILIFKRAEFR